MNSLAREQMRLLLLVITELIQHCLDLFVQASRLSIDNLLSQRVARHLNDLLYAPEEHHIAAGNLCG